MPSIATTPEYSHTQTAPLCVPIYGLAITFLALGVLLQEAPIPWLFPPIGGLLAVLAASFHHLTVEDQGELLAIRFGPIPLFRRHVKYAEIASTEIGRTLLLDGWGIHLSIRGGWVWNLWGRTCVVVRFENGETFRIGTDDGQNLAAFLHGKINR